MAFPAGDFRRFLGLAGLPELCGQGSRGPARAARPGQRGAVTSGARPGPTRALPFIETLLALELIIHHSLSIFEQGLYLRSSRFNHLVSNRFELLSHGPWGGERETVTATVGRGRGACNRDRRTRFAKKPAEGPLVLSPHANPVPSAAGAPEPGEPRGGAEQRAGSGPGP